MKKILLVLAALAFSVAVIGCAEKKEEAEDKKAPEAKVEKAPEKAPATEEKKAE